MSDVARYFKNQKDEVEKVVYPSGIEVKPVYGPEDLERIGFSYEADLGAPGTYPFTRNNFAQGYRSREWTTRQYAGFGTPKETNERWLMLLGAGQTGLNVAFDLPTQMGLDSDDARAAGEVGRVGMAIDSLRDFEIAFEGVDMHKVGTSLTINAVASIMMAMYEAVAEKYGFDTAKISCTPQNDIIKEVLGRGAWLYDLDAAVKLIGDTIEYAVTAQPRTYPVSVCGYHIRESGANAAQEMAYAFLIANTYIDEVTRRGYEAKTFAGRISYNLNVFGNLWEQVAKFRAGRKVWARNLRERYGIEKPSDLMLKGSFGGGGSGLMKAEPENNIMRGAFYALAAALSGAQATNLCTFDEAYAIPTERSSLLGLRTLQVIMEEVGLRDTVDPLAGSYFIETLTKQMEEKILQEMADIEGRGGMVENVKNGYIGRKLARQAYEWEMGIERGELIKVGVNKYATAREEEVQLHEYNEAWQDQQIANLKEVRRTRDDKLVAQRLQELADAARAGKNVMPYLKEACLAYCTVGEMSDVFLEVFGPYKEPNVI